MKKYKTNSAISTLPVFLAFLCMGFGDVAGSLTDLIKEEYQLSNFMAGFVPASGFVMFGLLSVPFSLIMASKGKKIVLSLGLGIALTGLLIPVVFSFDLFLVLVLSILLLGAGAALLQVAGNPLMRDVSPMGKYARNLSFGQFVKAIGSLSGALIPAAAALWWGMDWKILFPIYTIVIGLTIFALILIPVQEKERTASPPGIITCLKLLGHTEILLLVLAIFLYVGAEVSMASKLPAYLEINFGLDIKKLGIASVGLFFLSIMIGRFMGGLILNWMNAAKFLLLTSTISLFGIAGLFLQNQGIAVVSIILIGLGFANIFPLIFSITVEKYPKFTNELSGLMVTAIIGGAILPLIAGKIADLSTITLSFLVPGTAILYAFIIALRNLKLIAYE
jgi:MFS transporter, FHS family, L-fucose permease